MVVTSRPRTMVRRSAPLAEASKKPSGVMVNHPPSDEPNRVARCWPDAVLQILAVLSLLPDSTRVPSGENATELTQAECPSKVRINCPLAASQSLSVLSQLPERRRAPSVEKVTASITPACPGNEP